MEKNIKTRIQHKHDTEANWNKATGFIPKIGELIVYDADGTYSYPRFKVGDGITSVVNLAFANEQVLSTQAIHGENKLQVSNIIDNYILDIDYESTLAFDTSEIVPDEDEDIVLEENESLLSTTSDEILVNINDKYIIIEKGE